MKFWIQNGLVMTQWSSMDHHCSTVQKIFRDKNYKLMSWVGLLHQHWFWKYLPLFIYAIEINSRYSRRCKTWFQPKNIIVSKVKGDHWVKKYENKILLRCLAAEIWAIMSKNWQNWDITKSGWLGPSISICKEKFPTYVCISYKK